MAESRPQIPQDQSGGLLIPIAVISNEDLAIIAATMGKDLNSALQLIFTEPNSPPVIGLTVREETICLVEIPPYSPPTNLP